MDSVIDHDIFRGLVSCNKDSSDVFISSVDPADTVWVGNSTTERKSDFQQLLDTLSTQPTENIIEDISRKQSFAIGNDIVIQFPENAFLDKSGNAAAGRGSSGLILLDSRGKMLKNRITGVVGDQALKTAFAIRIIFYKDGQELVVAPGKKITLFVSQPDPQAGYQLYADRSGSPGTSWVNFANGEISTGNLSGKRGYSMSLGELPWILAGKAVETGKTITIKGTLPKIFTNANTKMYLLLNDRNGLIEMNQDKNEKSFSAGNIPQRITVKIISVSSINNTYYLGTEDFETKNNEHIKINPKVVSLSELNSFMNSLQ